MNQSLLKLIKKILFCSTRKIISKEAQYLIPRCGELQHGLEESFEDPQMKSVQYLHQYFHGPQRHDYQQVLTSMSNTVTDCSPTDTYAM